jgi:glycosyltransferase involved in cell wall biosynthesis
LLDLGHIVHLAFGTARIDERFEAIVESLSSYKRFYPVPLPTLNHELTISDLGCISHLTRYFRGHPDIQAVHCHSTKAGLVGRIAAKLCGIPSVYTPHGILSRDPTVSWARRRQAALLERMLAAITTRVIAVSGVERDHILEIGVPAERVELVPNGVDLTERNRSTCSRDAIRSAWGIEAGQVCVGFVGRLVVQKSPETLLRAFAIVAARVPEARLMIVGDGPLRPTLELIARNSGIEQRLIWCGGMDARNVFPAFDVFALSSCSESCPYVVLEAMACGLPVVATAVGGVPDLVRAGVDGLLSRPGDAAEFGAHLTRLCSEARLRREMSDNAWRRSQTFSLQSMVKRIEEMYVGIADRPSYAKSFTPSQHINEIR